jgi:hypothetical protein
MPKIDIDESSGIAVFSPDGKLSESDFKNASGVIDPYIEQCGQLKGLIISTQSFPGWDSFSALLSHLRFVRDHHKKIRFVAFLTDSPVGGLGEHVARHFVSAQIKAFPYGELEQAKKWIMGSSDAQGDHNP